MAFSSAERGLGPAIALLAVVVVVLFLLVRRLGARRTVGAVAAGLVIGGALGNLLDRAFRGDSGFLGGAVVDFIDLQWWPVFNVADAAIVVGCVHRWSSPIGASRPCERPTSERPDVVRPRSRG